MAGAGVPGRDRRAVGDHPGRARLRLRRRAAVVRARQRRPDRRSAAAVAGAVAAVDVAVRVPRTHQLRRLPVPLAGVRGAQRRAAPSSTVVPLSALRLAVTFAIAIASFYLVEQPIRERRFLPKPRLGLGVTAMAIPAVALLGFAAGEQHVVVRAGERHAAGDRRHGRAADAARRASHAGVGTDVDYRVTTPAPRSTPVGGRHDIAGHRPPARPRRRRPPLPAGADPAGADPGHRRLHRAGDRYGHARLGRRTTPTSRRSRSQAFGGCGILDEGDRLLPRRVAADLARLRRRSSTRRPGSASATANPTSWSWCRASGTTPTTGWPDDPTPRSALDPVYRERAMQRFTELQPDAARRRRAPGGVGAVSRRRRELGGDRRDVRRPGAARGVPRDRARGRAPTSPARCRRSISPTWSDEQGLTDDHAARPDGVHFTPESPSRSSPTGSATSHPDRPPLTPRHHRLTPAISSPQFRSARNRGDAVRRSGRAGGRASPVSARDEGELAALGDEVAGSSPRSRCPPGGSRSG